MDLNKSLVLKFFLNITGFSFMTSVKSGGMQMPHVSYTYVEN